MSDNARLENRQGTTLEANARRVFDARLERLDGATRSRLAGARAAAVEAASVPRTGLLAAFGAPRLVALGAAAALAVAVVWLPEQPVGPAVALTAFDDMDLLFEEEDLDLFEELEFYAWLDAEAMRVPAAVDPDGSG